MTTAGAQALHQVGEVPVASERSGFFGIVSPDGVYMDPAKVKAVLGVAEAQDEEGSAEVLGLR